MAVNVLRSGPIRRPVTFRGSGYMTIKRPELEVLSNENQNIEYKSIRSFGKEDIYWYTRR